MEIPRSLTEFHLVLLDTAVLHQWWHKWIILCGANEEKEKDLGVVCCFFRAGFAFRVAYFHLSFLKFHELMS